MAQDPNQKEYPPTALEGAVGSQMAFVMNVAMLGIGMSMILGATKNFAMPMAGAALVMGGMQSMGADPTGMTQSPTSPSSPTQSPLKPPSPGGMGMG